MKVLVAGGAGFIGSNLVDALLAEGHNVVCVDNFFIGTRQNIAHLKEHPRFKFYEQDLCDLEAVKRIFEMEEVEFVFHMAANSDIQASAKTPEVEFKNTYTTTFNILEAMRTAGVKRLFFCSTSAVYGDAQGMKMDENFSPLMPISYYGACKLGCEGLISAFSYMNGFHTLVAASGKSEIPYHPRRWAAVQAVSVCCGFGGLHSAVYKRYSKGCYIVQCRRRDAECGFGNRRNCMPRDGSAGREIPLYGRTERLEGRCAGVRL